MNKQGFIIDVPNVLIDTGEKSYISVTATEGQLTVEPEELTIEGGQGLYPLFQMNTKSVIKISLTDAKFNTDQFEVYGAVAATESRKRYEFETLYVVEEDNTVTITGRTLKAADFSLNGFTAIDGEDPASPEKGQVVLSSSGSDTKITFSAEDSMAGQTISPVYAYTEEAESFKFLEGVFPKHAKVILKFPLYGSEDGNSGSDSTVQIIVHKASISASPTIGGSYKTASTFSMELTAMDPRRADKEIWAIDVFDDKEA